MGATYINIELEVSSSRDLQPLKRALGDRFSVNYCGEFQPGSHLLAGALESCEAGGSPEATAAGLCDLVESLSPSERKHWEQADDRVLDVGLEANLDRRVVVDLFSSQTIERIAQAGIRLAVSVYALELEKELNP